MGEENINRRSVLKSVAPVGVGTSMINKTSSLQNELSPEQKQDIENRKVEKLTGRDKRSVQRTAMENNDFSTLYEDFVSKGWNFDFKGSECAKVDTMKDVQYHFFIGKFETGVPQTQRQAIVTWNNHPQPEATVTGKIFEYKESNVKSSKNSTASGTDSGKRWTMQTVAVENNQKNIINHSFETTEQRSSIEGCSVMYYECESIDWSCVIAAAAGTIGVISTCAGCVGTGGWLVPACGLCLVALTGTSATLYDCDRSGDNSPWQDNCTKEYRYATKEEVREHRNISPEKFASRYCESPDGEWNNC